jgi:hypothetical protein
VFVVVVFICLYILVLVSVEGVLFKLVTVTAGVLAENLKFGGNFEAISVLVTKFGGNFEDN